MTTHRLQVPRTARCEVLEPPAGVACTTRLWALHGYGQLAADFAAELAPGAAAGARVLAPEALSRFYLRGGAGRVGASWMTRAERAEEIADYVFYLDRVRTELASEGPPEVVLGFSQGTATAARWTVLGQVRPARLVLVGGGVPPDTDWTLAGPRLAALEVVLVAGSADEAFPPARAEEERAALAARGVRARTESFDGGHRLPPAELLVALVRAGG